MKTSQNVSQNQVWNYGEPLTVMERVCVRVPKRSDYMNFNSAHTFETAKGSVDVEARWLSRSVFPGESRRTVTMHRNYFGITETDLGKKITATVVVLEKQRGDIIQICVNIRKTGDVFMYRPLYDMEILEKMTFATISKCMSIVDCIPIVDTKQKMAICFTQR